MLQIPYHLMLGTVYGGGWDWVLYYSVPGKDVKRYIVKGEYIWKKIVSLTELSTPLDDYWFFFFWLNFCLILEGFEREMSLFDQDIYSVEDHIVIIK